MTTKQCEDTDQHPAHDWYELNLMWECPGAIAKSHKPLTTVRWDDLKGMYANREQVNRIAQYWDAQADLAHELHDRIPHLPIDTCRTIVSAVANGLPVVLTTRHGDRELGIVREFYPGKTSRITIGQWGFNAHVYFADVATVEPATA